MNELLNTVVDIAVLGTVLYAVMFDRNQPALRSTNTTFQCICVITMLVIAQQQYIIWNDCLYLLATSLLPILANHSIGYPVYLISNAVGIYRAITQTNAGIWQLAALFTAHFYLLVVNLDKASQDTFYNLAGRMIYREERRFMFAQQLSDIEIKAVPHQPERYYCNIIKHEFRYSPSKPLFLLCAVAEMVAYPLVPLFVINTALKSLNVAIIALNAHMLKSLDSTSSDQQYRAIGIALLLPVVKFLKLRHSLVVELMDLEWDRIAKAIDIELMSRMVNGKCLCKLQLKHRHTDIAKSYVENLKAIVDVGSDVLEVVMALWSIYAKLGVLIILPLLVHCVHNLSSIILNAYSNGNNTQYIASNCDDSYFNIKQMCQNIRSIKLFGWESRYLNAPLQRLNTNQNKCSWKVHIAQYACIVADCMAGALNEVTTCFMACVYLYRQPNIAACFEFSDLVQLTDLVSYVLPSLERIFSCINAVQSLTAYNEMIEANLKGDSIKTVARIVDILPDCTAHVDMKDCSFSWGVNGTPVLKNIFLSAHASELIVVTGAAGSGKSTFLLAACGEVKLVAGKGTTMGSISYLEQTPWLIDDTIKANIICSRAYDDQWYHTVLTACALDTDIAQWSKGDQTRIGKQGMPISGGQQARIALARTIYTQADIYILEDPLAAVDAQVKQHIMEQVILDTGLLKGKLRVISSNTHHIIPFASQVVTVANGQTTIIKQQPQEYFPVALNFHKQIKHMTGSSSNNGKHELTKQTTNITSAINGRIEDVYSFDNNGRSVYMNIKYIIGLCGLSIIIVPIAFGCLDPAIAYMADHKVLQLFKADNNAFTGWQMVVSYTALTSGSHVATRLIDKLAAHIKQNLTDRYVGNKLHFEFINGLIHAPLSFFDRLNEGNISDAYDEATSSVYSSVLVLLTVKIPLVVSVLLSAYHIIIRMPLLLLLVPVLLYINYVKWSIPKDVPRALQKLKRHVSAQKQTLLSSMADGQNVIRINGIGQHFQSLLEAANDEGVRLEIMSDGLSKMQTDVSHCIRYVSEMLVPVGIIMYSRITQSWLSSVELVMLQLLVTRLQRNITMLDSIPKKIDNLSQGISLLHKFSSIKAEAPYIVPETRPARNWPSKGQIEFNNFSMRYSPQLPWSVHNINLTIYPGEKLGIVGRTGAGKSSLIKSLFRLVPEGTMGTIMIDGVDIAQLGVGDLRPQIGVISQEGDNLTSSFRDYLDPLNQHSIEDIWAALIKCGLAPVVTQLCHELFKDRATNSCLIPNNEHILQKARYTQWQHSGYVKHAWLMLAGEFPSYFYQMSSQGPLDAPMHRLSTNLSQGQCQLLNLCRLLLQKHKIVVLDEATAQVDMDTDHQLQQLLRQELAACTVLTISHRLETIMHSDRVVVLDQGQVVEVGAPGELLQMGGYFADLVKSDSFRNQTKGSIFCSV